MMYIVMQMTDSQDESLKAITVRVSRATYDWLRQYAEDNGVSMNSVVSEAVSAYAVKSRRALIIKELSELQHSYELAQQAPERIDSVQDLREIRTSGRLVDAPGAGPERASSIPKREDTPR
jgi:hypothetical protein